MPPRITIPLFLLTLISLTSSLHAAGAIVHTYDYQPTNLTLILQDFNSTTPQHKNVQANTPTPPPAWISANNGYHTYDVDPTTNDGRINFDSTPYDVQYYTNLRVRLKGSSTSGSTTFWPYNAQGATTINLGNTSTNFTEVSRSWVDPTNPNIKTATEGGFRWDPNTVSSAITSYSFDYVMVDHGRVVGFEFDIDETPTTTGSAQILQTWRNATGRSDNYRIENSSLKGTTNHYDTYVQTATDLNLNTDIYQYVEIRAKTSLAVKLQFFWSTSTEPSYSESKSVFSPTTPVDEWQTYILDMTEEGLWSDTLTNFRIDIGSLAGNSYEIDYVRFREFGTVPEPARTTLILSALSLLLLQRRRQRPNLPNQTRQ